MKKTKEEWKKHLSPSVFHILWDKGTEPPFTGKYVDEKRKGIYRCAGCRNPLFSSDAKFHSGTGWPSFTKPVDDSAVITQEDHSLGMKRTEVLCASCGGHLGHVFPDGPAPEKTRFCMNSAALSFQEKEKKGGSQHENDR
jgi:peptide-methionine (R)-S-oxide reductase